MMREWERRSGREAGFLFGATQPWEPTTNYQKETSERKDYGTFSSLYFKLSTKDTTLDISNQNINISIPGESAKGKRGRRRKRKKRKKVNTKEQRKEEREQDVWAKYLACLPGTVLSASCIVMAFIIMSTYRPLLLPYLKRWSTECLSNLPKVTQLMGRENGMWTQLAQLQGWQCDNRWPRDWEIWALLTMLCRLIGYSPPQNSYIKTWWC